jgi:hypothetical protein
MIRAEAMLAWLSDQAREAGFFDLGDDEESGTG